MKLEDEIKTKGYSDPFERLVVNIMYTGNWLNYQHNQILKSYGLSSQQYNILRILRGQYPTPATVNLLKDRMLDKMSNASRLVEKLRSKSYIERRICSDDRRAVDIVLTQKGLKQLERLDEELQLLRNRLNQLTDREIQTVNHLLDKLRA